MNKKVYKHKPKYLQSYEELSVFFLLKQGTPFGIIAGSEEYRISRVCLISPMHNEKDKVEQLEQETEISFFFK